MPDEFEDGEGPLWSLVQVSDTCSVSKPTVKSGIKKQGCKACKNRCASCRRESS